MAGALESGAVRASVGCFTSDEDIDYFIQAMRDLKIYVLNQGSFLVVILEIN